MAAVLFYTRRVREAFKTPTWLLADLLFILFAGAIIGSLIVMGQQVSKPLSEKTTISLSIWALPLYTLMSLTRGFAAYILSLVFTLVYATVAAHHKRAEKLMIPALDVLQSIPVLSFLPSVVLAMIALFPTRELGLEIACVVMIFTGQAWNMTFSMFGSIKAIPAPLKEAARVYRMGPWRIFRLLELPASMIGLVWNSMMSMAGGWFVLTLSEAFTLQNRDFRLPGIGSYMGEAISSGNVDLFKYDPATHANHLDMAAVWTWMPAVAAVIAMVTMIVAVDQLFWRPIVAWSERFKMEETAEVDKPQSWVLDLLRHSRIYDACHRWMKQRQQARLDRATQLARRPAAVELAAVATFSEPATLGRQTPGPALTEADAPPSHGNGDALTGGAAGSRTARRSGNGSVFNAGSSAAPARQSRSTAPSPVRAYVTAGLTWVLIIGLVIGSGLGVWSLTKLLVALPIRDPSEQDWIHVVLALGASFLRTSASIVIGGLWTLPVGIIIGLSPRWSQRLQPVVQVIASFPANMIFPLITLFLAAIHFPFTIGCIALMLLGTQWYILFNVIAGAMAIPGDLKEVQSLFGTGWVKRWTRLYIPCVFPYLVTGLVTAAGGAWNATIVSEYVKIGDDTHIAFGIGSMISEATDAGNYPLLASATVSLAATVVLVNRFFWKRLYRVAEERYTLHS